MSNHPISKSSSCNASKIGFTNIIEHENEWSLEVLAPGYLKTEISMEVEDNTLKIKAVKKQEKKNYFRNEFQIEDVKRSFKLPKNIDSDNISANLESGILTISIPKSELAKPKQISIK